MGRYPLVGAVRLPPPRKVHKNVVPQQPGPPRRLEKPFAGSFCKAHAPKGINVLSVTLHRAATFKRVAVAVSAKSAGSHTLVRRPWPLAVRPQVERHLRRRSGIDPKVVRQRPRRKTTRVPGGRQPFASLFFRKIALSWPTKEQRGERRATGARQKRNFASERQTRLRSRLTLR